MGVNRVNNGGEKYYWWSIIQGINPNLGHHEARQQQQQHGHWSVSIVPRTRCARKFLLSVKHLTFKIKKTSSFHDRIFFFFLRKVCACVQQLCKCRQFVLCGRLHWRYPPLGSGARHLYTAYTQRIFTPIYIYISGGVRACFCCVCVCHGCSIY